MDNPRVFAVAPNHEVGKRFARRVQLRTYAAAGQAKVGDGQHGQQLFRGFREILELDKDVMSRIGSKLDGVFDPWVGLEHTELAYERLGLGVKAK